MTCLYAKEKVRCLLLRGKFERAHTSCQQRAYLNYSHNENYHKSYFVIEMYIFLSFPEYGFEMFDHFTNKLEINKFELEKKFV